MMATMTKLVLPGYCLARLQITGWESVSRPRPWRLGLGTGTRMVLCRGRYSRQGAELRCHKFLPAERKAVPDAARIAQATALEIPVTVQGSRSVKGTEERELFTETTTTILTFDSGAVLNLKSRVLEGQSLFLRNDQSGREILCKVLESPPEGETGCTDLEFTVIDPEFWGVPAEEPAADVHKPVDQKPQEAPEAIETAKVFPAATPRVEPGLLASGEIAAPVQESPASPLPPDSPETAEMLPEHAEGSDLQDAKDAEQLATMLAKESRGSSARRA